MMFGRHNCQGILLGILIVMALMSIIEFKGTYPSLDGEVQVAHDLRRFVDIIPLSYNSCVSNVSVPDNWCLDDSNIPRYVGSVVGTEVWPPRTIKHYTHAGYEQCLVDKTVVYGRL